MTASTLLYWLWGRQWSGKQTYLVLKLNLVLRLQGKIQSDRKADNRFAVASRLNVCPHRAISKTMQCLTFLWQPFLLYFSHYVHVHYTLQSDVSKAFSYLNSPTPPAWENLISPPFSLVSPLIPSHYFLYFHFRHLCTFLSCAFELPSNFCFLLLMSLFFLSIAGLSLSLKCFWASPFLITSSLLISLVFSLFYAVCFSPSPSQSQSLPLFLTVTLKVFPPLYVQTQSTLLSPPSLFSSRSPNCLPAWDPIMPPLMFQLPQRQEYNRNMIYYI